MPSDLRRGVSLIEVVVVFFIVGVLLALVLSATLHAREAARRAQCVSHLKNLGVGMNNYHSSRGAFPPGVGDYSLFWSLLPFVGEEARYATTLDRDQTAGLPIPSLYLCPSDTSRRGSLSEFATSYAANAGVVARNPPENWDGAFADVPLASRDVVDGLSYTVAVSEWIVGDGDESHASRLGSIFYLLNDFPDTPAGFYNFERSCEAISSGYVGRVDPFKGEYWFRGNLAASLYTHALPPDRPSCRAIPDLNAITAGSLHGGGANILMLDGSARFVRDDIRPVVWRALGTRSGGDSVDGHSN